LALTSEEVDALHEQYETAVEENESDDDQMIAHRTFKMPSDETDDDSYNGETRLTHVKKAARDVEKKRNTTRTFELNKWR
jgi:hypothetical protein